MGLRALKVGFMQRMICIVLAASMACAPSMNLLAQTNGAAQAAGQPKAATSANKIDTTYVTPGAVVMAVLRPAQLMKSKAGQMLPVEVATAAGLKYLGIDPANVEVATGFLDSSNPTVPNYGLTLKFVQPQAGLKLPQDARAHTQNDQLNGKSYFKSQQAELPSFYAPDKSTLIIAPDQTLRQLVENSSKTKSSPLIDHVHKVAGGSDFYLMLDLATLRPLIQMGLAEEQLPPEIKPFADAVTQISTAELTVNLSNSAPTELVVLANDADAAEKVEVLLKEGLAKAREQMRADLAPQMESEDPVERAFAQYMERVSRSWSQPFMPTRDGAKLTFFRIEGSQSPQQQLTTTAVMGVLVALLMPAAQAAREAARRTQSMNNLRQMSLGMLNYESARKTLPNQAICDKDGKPLLSWRVQILPYMDQQELYNQFHLDEPWDSEHNRALIPQMPQIYANPNAKVMDGTTNYLAVVGKECVFDGTNKAVGLRNITDGTSKTIAIVEADADKAVDWTKPDDLRFDANNPTTGLGHLRPGGWLAAFLDGHIQFISNNVDPHLVKAMVTKAGGESIQLP
jgi:type II secretory pathway pseudopilin PulG